MTRVALVEGFRTPFVKAGTLFSELPSQELARTVLRELIERTELDPKSIDEVILGTVAQPIEALNISRIAAARAGVPLSVPAYTVTRNCASGLEAITEGFEKIRSGQAHTILAGGTESMSNFPFQFPPDATKFAWRRRQARTWIAKTKALFSARPGMLKPVSTLHKGLTDPLSGLLMGETAEVLAKEFRISRDEQDAFALESHQRAKQAKESRRFEEEIVPIYVPGEADAISRDVGPRNNLSIDTLKELPSIFDPRHGSVTVGNSSPITDGAAAVLLMSEARVRVLGVRPLAWIRSYSFAGLDPRKMGLGPAVATALALRQAGISMREIGLLEINEAFAAQVLAVLRVFEKPALGKSVGANAPELSAVDPKILNVNGGAIALGHPIGASGTRITLTLAKQLKSSNVPFGLASLCVGGGQGGAILLENA